MTFSLHFNEGAIKRWASLYPAHKDREPELIIAPAVRDRGYLTDEELYALCRWKAPRSAHHSKKNGPDYVEAVTKAALSSPNERFRIEALTLLHGVGWPTASVILHFGSNDRYPVLDVRALWSLGVGPPPQYDFEFWWNYSEFCRALAGECGVSMRTLDRALWQYSRANQGKLS